MSTGNSNWPPNTQNFKIIGNGEVVGGDLIMFNNCTKEDSASFAARLDKLELNTIGYCYIEVDKKIISKTARPYPAE